jgi:RHS repeat-associated protein
VHAWIDSHNSVQKTSYLPFGEEVTATKHNRRKFGTYVRDDFSELDYAQQRYYSSALGRFISPDPYEGSANIGSPDSWNRYAYVSNDPINFTDPAGLSGTRFPVPKPKPKPERIVPNITGNFYNNSSMNNVIIGYNQAIDMLEYNAQCRFLLGSDVGNDPLAKLETTTFQVDANTAFMAAEGSNTITVKPDITSEPPTVYNGVPQDQQVLFAILHEIGHLNGIIFSNDNPDMYPNGSQDQKDAKARQDSNNQFIMAACFNQ